MRARSCGSGSRRSAHRPDRAAPSAGEPGREEDSAHRTKDSVSDRPLRKSDRHTSVVDSGVEAMESEYQTVGQMYERLRLMIRQRNDTGFRLAVTDAVLEPRNPFEPARKRRPKSVVAITLILVLVLALTFLYFSCHDAR